MPEEKEYYYYEDDDYVAYDIGVYIVNSATYSS